MLKRDRRARRWVVLLVLLFLALGLVGIVAETVVAPETRSAGFREPVRTPPGQGDMASRPARHSETAIKSAEPTEGEDSFSPFTFREAWSIEPVKSATIRQIPGVTPTLRITVPVLAKVDMMQERGLTGPEADAWFRATPDVRIVVNSGDDGDESGYGRVVVLAPQEFEDEGGNRHRVFPVRVGFPSGITRPIDVQLVATLHGETKSLRFTALPPVDLHRFSLTKGGALSVKIRMYDFPPFRRVTATVQVAGEERMVKSKYPFRGVARPRFLRAPARVSST